MSAGRPARARPAGGSGGGQIRLLAARCNQPPSLALRRRRRLLLLLLSLALAPQPGLARAGAGPEAPEAKPEPASRGLAISTSSHRQRRPDSSSSMFAEVEDLNDSSIRTRFGTILVQPPAANGASTIEHLGDTPADFDRLIERILPQQQQAQLQQASASQQQQQLAPADANNKTTMRFFRNSKTFASVVYMNEQRLERAALRLPRRLINCHLVDLEKHSSDVALYESKYGIKTIDIDFREMMQLIEACTNIARLRRKPLGLLLNSSLATGRPEPARPHLVVGRPLPLAGALAEATTGVPWSSPPPPPLQQQRQHHQRALQTVMSPGASLTDSSAKLDLARGEGRTRRHEHQQQQQQQQPPAQRQLRQPKSAARARKLLSKALESSKRLVLGEVTPPPSAVDGSHGGGLREAIQEITAYDTTDLLSIWRGILPGTNWCGMGDRASSYNDLGFESDIDICCRAHDFCPVRLSAFTSGYGLFNWSFYTRSHCWCDQNFLDCLQQADSPLSSVVMKFYFTIMKTTCLSDNETNVGQSASSRAQPAGGETRGWPFAPFSRPPAQRPRPAGPTDQQVALQSGPPIPALRQSQLFQAKVEQVQQRP